MNAKDQMLVTMVEQLQYLKPNLDEKDKLVIADACHFHEFLSQLATLQHLALDQIKQEMSGKLDKLSSDLVYELKKAEHLFIKNIVGGLQDHFKSIDRQQISKIRQKLVSIFSSVLNEAEIQMTFNQLGLKLAVDKTNDILASPFQYAASELNKIFSDQARDQLKFALHNRLTIYPEALDFEADIYELKNLDEFEKIILNRQFGDPRLRQFLIFGFFVRMFHPTWNRPQQVQIYCDQRLKLLFWRLASQTQHSENFLDVKQIKKVVVGHSTSAWTKINTRK